MESRPITSYPTRILRRPGEEVTSFDSPLEDLANDMFETMYKAKGVGLAAAQVGVSLRLFVMDCDGLKLIAANPEIISEEGEQNGEEGCLSLGSIPAELKRPMKVVLGAQSITGEFFETEATGLAARCFLHETDHCNGILFIDHLSPLRRDMVTRRFRKLRKSGQ
jgi:peptide deformylase